MNELPFAVLFEALKHNYDTYLNNVWTTLGLLLLCIGWFLTSEKMHTLLKKNYKYLFRVTIFTLVVHFITLWFYYCQSKKILVLINKDFEYLCPYVEYFKIEWYYPLFILLLTGSLYLVLILIIRERSKEQLF